MQYCNGIIAHVCEAGANVELVEANPELVVTNALSLVDSTTEALVNTSAELGVGLRTTSVHERWFGLMWIRWSGLRWRLQRWRTISGKDLWTCRRAEGQNTILSPAKKKKKKKIVGCVSWIPTETHRNEICAVAGSRVHAGHIVRAKVRVIKACSVTVFLLTQREGSDVTSTAAAATASPAATAAAPAATTPATRPGAAQVRGPEGEEKQRGRRDAHRTREGQTP
jgi:hypothetical protein